MSKDNKTYAIQQSDTDDLQAKLTALLQTLQLDDAPAGGAVVIYHRDKLLACAQVGQALADTPWTMDTLALNFSTGKGVLVTLVHVLASQGLLDYDTPISEYWAQFGSHGKQDITLRQVLTHQANLFDITSVTTCSNDMLDWPSMVEKIAHMSPTPPQAEHSQSAYSALVSGWVLGALIEQVCHQPLNQALRLYLTEPLGIADAVYFGVPSDKVQQVAQPVKNFVNGQRGDDRKVAHLSQPQNPAKTRQNTKPTLKADTAHIQATYQGLPSYECWQQHYLHKQAQVNQAGAFNTTNTTNTNNTSNTMDGVAKNLSTLQINSLYFDVSNLSKSDYKRALVANARAPLDYYEKDSLSAVIPAANGVASAHALAIIYAMLADGGIWQGKTLIDEATFTELSRIYVTGSDAIMPAATNSNTPQESSSMQWRLGYHRLFSVCHEAGQGFGHMGYNGSVAWCEPKRQLAFAFVHNFDTTMLTDIRQFALTEVVLQWFDNI